MFPIVMLVVLGWIAGGFGCHILRGCAKTRSPNTLCGNCGYELLGLAVGQTCPECGSASRTEFEQGDWLRSLIASFGAAAIGFILIYFGQFAVLGATGRGGWTDVVESATNPILIGVFILAPLVLGWSVAGLNWQRGFWMLFRLQLAVAACTTLLLMLGTGSDTELLVFLFGLPGASIVASVWGYAVFVLALSMLASDSNPGERES